jgi:hypothetical protein
MKASWQRQLTSVNPTSRALPVYPALCMHIAGIRTPAHFQAIPPIPCLFTFQVMPAWLPRTPRRKLPQYVVVCVCVGRGREGESSASQKCKHHVCWL